MHKYTKLTKNKYYPAKNKFESIVIRILDDRNVIRDLSKLGIIGYAQTAFNKAISQPQGMVILTGPTGSGKSTIAQLITRLETQTSGSILLNGTDLKRNRSKNVSLGYRKKVQMIFQDPFGSLNNIHNVYHHLSRPILRHNIVSKRNISFKNCN